LRKKMRHPLRDVVAWSPSLPGEEIADADALRQAAGLPSVK
jgi:hypothetical protein